MSSQDKIMERIRQKLAVHDLLDALLNDLPLAPEPSLVDAEEGEIVDDDDYDADADDDGSGVEGAAAGSNRNDNDELVAVDVSSDDSSEPEDNHFFATEDPFELSHRRPPPRSSHRTVLCKFLRNGFCRAGDDCTFSHSAELSRRAPVLCSYYASGGCKKFASCPHLHGEFPCVDFHTSSCHRMVCRYSHAPLDDYGRALVEKRFHETSARKLPPLNSHLPFPPGPKPLPKVQKRPPLLRTPPAPLSALPPLPATPFFVEQEMAASKQRDETSRKRKATSLDELLYMYTDDNYPDSVLEPIYAEHAVKFKEGCAPSQPKQPTLASVADTWRSLNQ